MALSIPCAACGYRMQADLVGVTFKQFVVDNQGNAHAAPDGLNQYLLCRTCAEYFERAFADLEAIAVRRQAATAAQGAL
jgi:hypothetical protein